MLRTFNLGVGLTIVCKKESSQDVINHVKKSGINAYEIRNYCKTEKNKLKLQENLIGINNLYE
ncbi:MAG: hypothetical protein K2H53_05705 [Clostridia bacterium]|nr:hypothetical protein [Clostridia bacterium]